MYFTYIFKNYDDYIFVKYKKTKQYLFDYYVGTDKEDRKKAYAVFIKATKEMMRNEQA